MEGIGTKRRNQTNPPSHSLGSISFVFFAFAAIDDVDKAKTEAIMMNALIVRSSLHRETRVDELALSSPFMPTV